MPKLVIAIRFKTLTPLIYVGVDCPLEIRCYEAGEIVAVDTGDCDVIDSYVPCEEAANLIFQGRAEPIYSPITIEARREDYIESGKVVRDTLLVADKAGFHCAA